jgi:prolipoprotein diacylglyceryltransferase
MSMAVISLLALLGSRLFTMNAGDVYRALIHQDVSGFSGRSATGALLFGLAGLIYVQRFFRLKSSLPDLYAFTALIGFGIQKLGCFFNGCCFGTETSSVLGIRYAEGANAHYHAWAGGNIQHIEMMSPLLHPVQLYESILLILSAILVLRAIRFFRQQGSAFALALSLYFGVRFTLSFFREPETFSSLGQMALGLMQIQWLFVLMAFISLVLLLLNEKYALISMKGSGIERSLLHEVINIAAVAMLALVFQRVFTPLESLAFLIRFVPALLVTVWVLYHRFPGLLPHAISVGLLLLPLLIIAQELKPDTLDKSSQDSSYRQYSFGTSFGTYNSSVEYNPQPGSCGTSYTHAQYKYDYLLFGGGYSKTTVRGKKSSTYGINGFLGSASEIRSPATEATNYLILGISPFARYDSRWFGIGAGAHLGTLRWVPLQPVEKFSISSGTQSSPVLPMMDIRIGRRDILDLRLAFASGIITPFPVNLWDLSVGSGFGLPRVYGLRFGGIIVKEDFLPYMQLNTMITSNIGLTSRLVFPSTYYDYMLTSSASNPARLELMLHYRR